MEPVAGATPGAPELEGELEAWEAARVAKDWPRADGIRASLRAAGVDPTAMVLARRRAAAAGEQPQERCWPARLKSKHWARGADCLEMVGPAGYLAQTPAWGLAPQSRYKEAAKELRAEVGCELGQRLADCCCAAAAAASSDRPMVLYVEKTFIRGFVEGFRATALTAAAGGAAEVATDAADVLPCCHSTRRAVQCCD